MLKTSHISNVEIYSDEWNRVRLGRFTSSKISVLMYEKNVTDGALSYIHQKVGEQITGIGVDVDEQVEDENTQWGKEYEPAAIRRFGEIKEIEFLVTQKVIFDPDTRFSSTPDAVWIHGPSVLKADEYNVSTLEVKCPRKYPRFLELYMCKTPADLRKVSSKYYWQVMDQMYNCDSAVGYFACFHPLFPAGKNMKIIQFNKVEMWPEFKKMKDRKEEAVRLFDQFIAEFV